MLLSCLVLLMSLAAMGQTYTLTYEGFPYMKTICGIPSYSAGTEVKLSWGRPIQEKKWFDGWQYNNKLYQPGTIFTMPAEDVVLVPVFSDISEGIEDVPELTDTKNKGQKIIKDGQLLIIHNGAIYNVLGERVK